jgi:RNA polymerase sigma-70 factor (ECF subfamily)
MNTEPKKAEKSISLKMLEQLIDNHQSGLLKFAFFILGSMPESEDVVQETFVKFYRQPLAITNEIKAKAYLFRMVNNACIDLIRKNGFTRTVPLNAIANLPDQQINGSVGEQTLESEFRRIKSLLKTIPDEQSEIIRMRTIGDLSFVEIAQILKIPVSTVKSRFKYGIDKLRKKSEINKEVYYEM